MHACDDSSSESRSNDMMRSDMDFGSLKGSCAPKVLLLVLLLVVMVLALVLVLLCGGIRGGGLGVRYWRWRWCWYWWLPVHDDDNSCRLRRILLNSASSVARGNEVALHLLSLSLIHI